MRDRGLRVLARRRGGASSGQGDGSDTTSPDVDWGGLPGLEGSLSGLVQAADLELDAYGVPVQDRPPGGLTYRLSVAAVICGVVSAGLAITEAAGHRMLPGYLVALGMVSGLLAAAVGSTAAETIPKSRKGWHVEVVRRICRWAFLLGILGLIGMVIASGHGAALNDAP